MEYRITTTLITYSKATFYVEAKSEEQAKEMVASGTVPISNEKFQDSEQAAPSEWLVELAE